MNLIQKLNLDHRATPLLLALVTGAGAAGLAGCDRGQDAAPPAVADDHEHDGEEHADHEDHMDGEDHDHMDGEDHDHMDGGDQHADEDVSLGTITIGAHTVEAWQGHGEIAPGKELHLVLKLTPADNGASVVRTWIGTENRLSSIVARADFNASSGEYDAHAMAPIPLPEDARWWIEIERPDGTLSTGSLAAK